MSCNCTDKNVNACPSRVPISVKLLVQAAEAAAGTLLDVAALLMEVVVVVVVVVLVPVALAQMLRPTARP
jgi:predicted Na+-dependent transporter